MILASVLCPHPPLLFRELSGRRDVAADLRAACSEALGEALALEPDAVVVVAGADQARHWNPAARPDVQRFGRGGPRGEEDTLPLSLGVGRRLLDEAGWSGHTPMISLGWDATDDEIGALLAKLHAPSGRVALLLLGDGGTRRGDKAPGYLDERAFPFDRAVADALASGDAGALRGLDTALADELMVLGRTAFRVLGAAWPDGPEKARLLYADDPFGVMYLVALWTHGSAR